MFDVCMMRTWRIFWDCCDVTHVHDHWKFVLFGDLCLTVSPLNELNSVQAASVGDENSSPTSCHDVASTSQCYQINEKVRKKPWCHGADCMCVFTRMIELNLYCQYLGRYWAYKMSWYWKNPVWVWVLTSYNNNNNNDIKGMNAVNSQKWKSLQ